MGGWWWTWNGRSGSRITTIVVARPIEVIKIGSLASHISSSSGRGGLRVLFNPLLLPLSPSTSHQHEAAAAVEYPSYDDDDTLRNVAGFQREDGRR